MSLVDDGFIFHESTGEHRPVDSPEKLPPGRSPRAPASPRRHLNHAAALEKSLEKLTRFPGKSRAAPAQASPPRRGNAPPRRTAAARPESGRGAVAPPAPAGPSEGEAPCAPRPPDVLVVHADGRERSERSAARERRRLAEGKAATPSKKAGASGGGECSSSSAAAPLPSPSASPRHYVPWRTEALVATSPEWWTPSDGFRRSADRFDETFLRRSDRAARLFVASALDSTSQRKRGAFDGALADLRSARFVTPHHIEAARRIQPRSPRTPSASASLPSA